MKGVRRKIVKNVVKEAQMQFRGSQAGLFCGSYERHTATANGYGA